MIRKIVLSVVAWCFLWGAVGCSEAAEKGERDNQLSSRNVTSPIRHVIVYKEAGRFCGWPANNGIWSWGNEILVGFHLDYYKENTRGHSIDRDKPRQRVLARSFDGGQTWKLEKPDGLNSKKQSLPCPGGVNFTHPDFALTCRGDYFYFSYDRGKTWHGPYKLLDFGQKKIMARTDYIVNSQNDCLIFLTASKTNGKEGRPFCTRTTDGFKTLSFVSWIGPEPEGFSIMPSTVRCSRTKLVSAIRRKEQGLGSIDLYASNDDGRTWQLLSTPASTGGKNGNPPSTVRLPDGRIVVTYGYRSPPQGIRAAISSDEGKTWSKEIILRLDGRTWDLGYPQTVQRPDGKLVTTYYFTTEENPQQHIAATIWDPDAVSAMSSAKKADRTQVTTEGENTKKPDHSKVPGVVIDYSPPQSKIYLGCPSIAILSNGDYVASHSFFGPASKKNRIAVFRSTDQGKTWQKLTDIIGQWWSNLFLHNGALYIMGTSGRYGNVVIRRSTDGGRTWTVPKNDRTGLLLSDSNYHTAPVPVVVHNGRIWRAFEEKGWKAFVMSAPAEADLLKAENWLMSSKLLVDKRANIFKWLEGNVVVTADGKLVNMLRTQKPPARAAMIHISDDGRELSFDPNKDMINFPGGAKKFTIRYDKVTCKYWSLVNIVTDPGPLELDAVSHRNTLALTCSKDLRNWRVRYIPLSFMKGRHLTEKNNKFGFQYIDWLIEGNDIIFVSRTAWGWDTPRSHDANYFTFHRIQDFRQKTLKDEPLYCGPPFGTHGLERVKYNNPGLVVDLGVGLWAWPLPMDYDGDGDNDLIVSCPDKPYNGTYFFENASGNAKLPVFKLGVRLGRGYKHAQVSYVDREPRVLIPAKELVNFRNRDSNFEKTVEIYPTDRIHKARGRIRARQWKYCDYDSDGDQDLIAGIADWTDYGWDNAFNSEGKWTKGPLHGYVYLIRNDGTTKKPTYAEPVQVIAGGKPVDVYGMPSPNLADFDGDGDLDLLCGEFVDKFTYFENIGTRNEPKYAAGRYLTYNGHPLTMDLCMIVPVALDWDKDGDVDLVVGQEDGRVAFVENTGKVVNGLPQFLPAVFFQQEAADIKFGALVTPCSFDWDGDGDEDLICGNTAGYIGFIENLDGGNPPKWAAPKYLKADDKVIRIQAGYNGSIQGPCEAKWGYTTLSIADWDHDGLVDIVVNSIWGEVLWYRNIGARQKPKLTAAQPIEVEWQGKPPKPAWTWWEPKDNQLVTQWRTTPVIIDLNRDGLNDLVMLDNEGYLAFFERAKKGGNLVLLPGKRIFKNEAGDILRLSTRTAGGSGRRKLCFVDWDGDGKLDLLANSHDINFLRNMSKSKNEYVFEDKGLVDERILAGHSTSPTVVDWDKNGIPDLLVGAEDGFLYYMQNPRAPDTGTRPPNF